MEVAEKIEEMIMDGELDEDAEEYLEMLSYLLRPQKESIMEAVGKGKKGEEKICEPQDRKDVDLSMYLSKD